MKAIFALFVLFSASINAQVADSIKITPLEFPAIIVEVPNKTNAEIYTKIKSWINRYYKNPSLITIADEKDNYIRIHAVSKFSFKQMGLSVNDYRYDMEIEIKDGRYRIYFFNVLDTSILNGELPKTFFKKNGELYGIKKVNLSMQKGILESLNQIHFSLFNYIYSKSDW